MNILTNKKNNYLLLTEDFNNDILKFCIRETIKGKTVVLFTKKTPDLYTVCTELDKEISSLLLLDQFVIIECASLEVLTKKLMNLIDWLYVPSLVILDLTSYIDAHSSDLGKNKENKDSTTTSTTEPFLQRLCLCISTFLLYMETVEAKMKKKCVEKNANKSGVTTTNTQVDNNNNNKCYSLAVVKENALSLSLEEIHAIIGLYYYNDNAFDSLDDILTRCSSGV